MIDLFLNADFIRHQDMFKIIFCLPGSHFTGSFLDSWSNLLIYCISKKIQFAIQRKESSVVNYARTKCLAANVLRGRNQKPFDGKLDYTHLMWIDSDIVFKPEQFQKLLNLDKDIVAGVYSMQDGIHYAAVEEWDEEYFLQNGTFKFLKKDGINGRLDLLNVAYSGMGFMLIKKGVFESIDYPWFEPIHQEIKHIVDFTSEDVAFCLKAGSKGFKIFIDPTIIVGHEKNIIL